MTDDTPKVAPVDVILRELLHRTDQFLASESGSRLASVAANNYAKDVRADVAYLLETLSEETQAR